MTTEGIGPMEPAEALWQAIEGMNLGVATADEIVGSAESRLGRPLVGSERADLLSLAEGEVEYYRDNS